MSLKKQILEDLKNAMRSGDTAKRDTLRLLDAMVKNMEIEKKKREEGLTDAEIQEVIARAIKQRKDAMAQYEAGGRADLVEKEKKETEILSVYMPKQIGEDDVRKIVKEIIKQNGISSVAEMGKIMGLIMGRLKGQADGNLVRKIVEEELK